MNMKNNFISIVNENMILEDELDEKISIVEDLSIPESIYNGIYMNEAVDMLFSND